MTKFAHLVLLMLVCACVENTRSNTNSLYQPRYDTTINNTLILRNSKSIETTLGDISMKLDTTIGLPEAYFHNINGSERLRLIFCPGDSKNTISIFEVSKIVPSTNVILPSTIKTFKTESGVTLNLSVPELISIKGEPHQKLNRGDTLILKYSFDTSVAKEFLAKYNMPVYFSNYSFLHNSLVSFSFGFEYP